jgi:hypothetical protein
MKTPEEWFVIVRDTPIQVREWIKEIQDEAYNQAIDDAVELMFSKDEIEEILKLKKK